jgi:hypothetical protein
MQRLQLDFRAQRAAPPWAGRLLLALAVAFAAHAAYSYTQLRLAVDAGRAALARAEPRAAPPREVPAAELAAVRETVERIGLPWHSLFRAVESAASDDIALTGIEPDPKTGTVVITGEARNYLAALGYVLNLARDEALSGAQLVRHEAKAADPQGPVSFAVSAGWSEARP